LFPLLCLILLFRFSFFLLFFCVAPLLLSLHDVESYRRSGKQQCRNG
jgi:hypothetical protein